MSHALGVGPPKKLASTFSDLSAAELDAAAARAFIGLLEHVAAEARGDVVGHDTSGGLGEHTGLRHRQTGDVSHGIDAGKRVARLLFSTGTQPSTASPQLSTTWGTRCTGIPTNRS